MRAEPDPNGSEAELLNQYLDYQRATLLAKTDGLDQRQMAQSHPPSTLTLSGLLYHLALVEEDWTEVRFLGMPDRQPWADIDWDADPNWEFGPRPSWSQSSYASATGRPATAAAS